MVRAYTNSMFLFSLMLLTPMVELVRIQNRYSLGDKFTYAENKTTTTVNLFTGETKVEKEETIYKEDIVELEDPLTNADAEIEKTYSFVRFTPPDERKARRLLSQRTREKFQKPFATSLSQYSVGDRWSDKVITGLEKHHIITRIYESDEYDTEVITVDTETIGTIKLFSYQTPNHYLVTQEVDVETGILLFEETIHRLTVIDERKTDITVKKLIKRETDIHEL